MTENNDTEITDPIEQQIWDSQVEGIVESAKMTQKIQFYKNKLNYHLQTNQLSDSAFNSLNSKQALSGLRNMISNLIDNFHKYHLKQTQEISNLLEKYKDKPRIEIMLTTARDNLKKILTYEKLHKPTFEDLTKQVNAISDAQTKPTQAADQDNQAKNI